MPEFASITGIINKFENTYDYLQLLNLASELIALRRSVSVVDLKRYKKIKHKILCRMLEVYKPNIGEADYDYIHERDKEFGYQYSLNAANYINLVRREPGRLNVSIIIRLEATFTVFPELYDETLIPRVLKIMTTRCICNTCTTRRKLTSDLEPLVGPG